MVFSQNNEAYGFAKGRALVHEDMVGMNNKWQMFFMLCVHSLILSVQTLNNGVVRLASKGPTALGLGVNTSKMKNVHPQLL